MSIFKNKKVLVTGASGLVGQAAIRKLLNEGSYVLACIHSNTNIDIHHENLKLINCDLLDYEICFEITKNIDYCLHFAAYMRGASGKNDANFYSDYIRKNLLINVNIINACVQNNVEKFGFVSSSTIYPDVNYAVSEEEGVTGQPHEAYLGIGNLMRYCESLMSYYQKIYSTNFAIARTTAIYGPFDNFGNNCQVIPMLIKKAKSKHNPFEIWGNGSQIRDFIYVDDVVDGLFCMMEKSCNAIPYNIAYGKGVDIKTLAHMINQIYNYDPEYHFDLSKPTMIPIRIVDTSKAKKDLNWEPSISLSEGLSKTINWYNNTTL